MKKEILAIKETITLAIQNHQKNNLREAENLYNEILKINPNHFKTLFYLGLLEVQTRRLDIAKQLFQRK